LILGALLAVACSTSQVRRSSETASRKPAPQLFFGDPEITAAQIVVALRDRGFDVKR
jgi:hypothetical protein